ncbi:hypothetical protein F1737_07715 [Methanoplanus sp. FWC-SCC4]|uniref:Uncharacterized protein n=1 Tax=Methanochimaera problematica TaxID=2609417 RepID=A0AA97FCY8_9EURY|nr:hypothetical protein F1737_07715 [Methanoplanus sp. FWC-SCC4]
MKVAGLGFLTWLLPLALSVFFYTKTGEPAVDITFFKTIMIVLFGGFGTVLLAYYFKGVSEFYIFEGFFVGAAWLVINWIMDFLILLPINGMDITTYFKEIGLRYILILIIAVSIGIAAEDAAGKSGKQNTIK